MRLILVPVLLFCLGFAAAVSAKPPLREVSEIDDRLMVIAIADEIRKTCDEIEGRVFKGIFTLKALRSRAKDLGYTDDEIDSYVNSKAEKKRMRQKAEAYLASQGVDVSDEAALCRYGREEIARGGPVGFFLK